MLLKIAKLINQTLLGGYLTEYGKGGGYFIGSNTAIEKNAQIWV